MASLLPVPARRVAVELLDDPRLVLPDLPANLRDIRFLNRWFGGTAAASRGLSLLAGSRNRLSLLDVCTGSADIPKALCRTAGARGLDLRVTALDVSPEVLAEAEATGRNPRITLVLGDARDLPWPAETFDVAMCCLALHHFEPDDAIRVLQEMWRVSRVGIIVADLVRGYLAYAGTWLVTRTVARNRLTRHDGPLSVLRAYTASELQALVEEAGLSALHITRRGPFRQTLVIPKRGPASAF